MGEDRVQAGELQCTFSAHLSLPHGTMLAFPAAHAASVQQLLILLLSSSIGSFIGHADRLHVACALLTAALLRQSV